MTASNRKLIAFLAAAVLVPVALVAGPFRERFFPADFAAVKGIARVEAPPLDRDAIVALIEHTARADGSGAAEALVDELAAAFRERRFRDAAARLERVPPAEAGAGVRYLNGLAELLDGHPARALAGLQDAAAIVAAGGAPALGDEPRHFLAQALLQLGRADAARVELRRLSARGGPRAAAAASQLRELAALD